ncbi:MAG: hypothetical protein V3T86_07515 [Planctomycetota bacterium]
MRFFALVLSGTLVLALGLAYAGGSKRKKYDSWNPSMQQMMFHAVLEGLYTDGVGNDDVDRILEKDDNGYTNFVYGCPICMPALDALRVYRARPKFYSRKGDPDTFGKGLDEATRKRLAGRPADRLAAIETLTKRWVNRRLKSMRLTESEQRDWRQRITEGRKRGMQLLNESRRNGQAGAYEQRKGCALCDGASFADVLNELGR